MILLHLLHLLAEVRCQLLIVDVWRFEVREEPECSGGVGILLQDFFQRVRSGGIFAFGDLFFRQPQSGFRQPTLCILATGGGGGSIRGACGGVLVV